MQLVIEPDGSMRCLYTEEIELAALGKTTISRGSNVEPDESGAWWADLTPVAGPKLGPYGQRSEALAAEVEWLESRPARRAIVTC